VRFKLLFKNVLLNNKKKEDIMRSTFVFLRIKAW